MYVAGNCVLLPHLGNDVPLFRLGENLRNKTEEPKARPNRRLGHQSEMSEDRCVQTEEEVAADGR